MSYLALYRRYRPDSFDNLIGQDHIVKTLINQISGNRLGHAYLFTGTRGTGKTSAAKIFAKAINCLNPQNGSPCGKCEACLALADPSNIDVIEIDAASNNGVNEIRDLREKVQYPPVSCRYKVYIVDEVHMLTGAAFNALLKTLEEPPKHAVFILATTEVHKIPATILSRCMRFDFRLIPTEKIAALISKIYDEQGKRYDKEAVLAVANAGDGSIRDALSIADIALSYGTGKLTYDDVMEILGSTNFDLLVKFISDILSGNAGGMLQTINSLCSLGKSMGVLTKDVTTLIRNLLVIKTCSTPNDILAMPEDKLSVLKSVSDEVTEQRLMRSLEIFSDAENALKYTTHPRVIFETAAIKASKPESDYDIDALLVRIKELEGIVKNGTLTTKPQIEMITPLRAQNSKSIIAEQLSNDETETFDLKSASAAEVRGKLLNNLRSANKEMLWNVMQTVKLSLSENVITLNALNHGDEGILLTNTAVIEKALECYLPFTLNVIQSGNGEKREEIDDETEKIKKIFGDDIVILK